MLLFPLKFQVLFFFTGGRQKINRSIRTSVVLVDYVDIHYVCRSSISITTLQIAVHVRTVLSSLPSPDPYQRCGIYCPRPLFKAINDYLITHICM